MNAPVVGAGTMGAGIARVAAVAGHPVVLFDAAPGSAEREVARIRERVKSLVDKGSSTSSRATSHSWRPTPSPTLHPLVLSSRRSSRTSR